MKFLNLSLRTKVLFLSLAPLFIFQTCMMLFNYSSNKSTLMQEKKDLLREVIVTASGALKTFHSRELSGELTREQAQTLASNYLKKLRYGKDKTDYIWVNDFNPKMIIHPKQALVGTDLSKFKDKAGKLLFVDIISLLKKSDSAYTNYSWNSKKDDSKFVPKLSYVSHFKPWGWILGSGIYVEDVETYIQEVLLKDVILLVVGLLIIAGLTIVALNKGVIKPLLIIANKLGDASCKVSDESEVSLNTSKHLSDATNEQASSLQETVSSIEEISKMIIRNSDAANTSKEISNKSERSAKNGKMTVDQMLISIQNIAKNNNFAMEKMEENSQNTHEILEIIKEIDEKTKVINDIVFQTKLLSFNASVEAARAGESGKGFAVVAEEVGSLASMSGKASEEIKSLLEKSITKVENIVSETEAVTAEVIKSGSKTVEEGTSKAKQCKEAFDEILLNIIDVGQRVDEIAEACKEQSIGVSEITEAMRSLDSLTHENNSAAQKASLNAEDLRQESEILDQTVGEVLYIIKGRNAA